MRTPAGSTAMTTTTTSSTRTTGNWGAAGLSGAPAAVQHVGVLAYGFGQTKEH